MNYLTKTPRLGKMTDCVDLSEVATQNGTEFNPTLLKKSRSHDHELAQIPLS